MSDLTFNKMIDFLIKIWFGLNTPKIAGLDTVCANTHKTLLKDIHNSVSYIGLAIFFDNTTFYVFNGGELNIRSTYTEHSYGRSIY